MRGGIESPRQSIFQSTWEPIAHQPEVPAKESPRRSRTKRVTDWLQIAGNLTTSLINPPRRSTIDLDYHRRGRLQNPFATRLFLSTLGEHG